MTTQNISNHIREVQMIADGGKSVRDPIIKESWLRCVRDHGLDPTDLKEAYIVPNHELRQHRDSRTTNSDGAVWTRVAIQADIRPKLRPVTHRCAGRHR
jgi:hypothetical protein